MESVHNSAVPGDQYGYHNAEQIRQAPSMPSMALSFLRSTSSASMARTPITGRKSKEE